MAIEQPDKGEKFTPRDHPEWLGKLFLIYPTEANVVQFEDGPAEMITADVAVVDLIDPETGKAKIMKGARIGGKAMVPQIKPKLSKANTAAAGRLRQLPAQGQKSGAYVLDDMSDADMQLAQQFDATPWRSGVEQPAAPAGPPTGAASQPQATPPPAAGGTPWFVTDPALLTKLAQNGVANPTTLDYNTAQMIGASFQ